MRRIMDKKQVLLKYVWITVATLLLALVSWAPLPETLITAGGSVLSPEGRAAFGVLLFCLVLWVTEPLPFHITGFFGLILLTFLGVDGFAANVRLGFGNDTVVFFLGVLILSAFMSLSGLGRRISLFMLSKTGTNTSAILFGFLLVGALMSMWITALAAAAILTPLAKALLEEQKLKPLQSNFGRALMIACSWGPLIGGIGTPAGAGPNQLAIGFMRDLLDIEFSFLEWMTYGVPASLALLFPAWLVLMLLFRPEMKHLTETFSPGAAPQDRQSMSRDEIVTLAALLLTVVLWIGSPILENATGIKFPASLPAIFGACLLFSPGVCSFGWKDIQKHVSWSGILLIATGVSLGVQLYQTGAAGWLSGILLGGLANASPLASIFIIIIVVSVLKVGLSSNTVTAAVVVPIIISTAERFHLPVMQLMLPACLTLSLAFILVTSTPTSVIPYSSGYFTIADMARAGVVMTLVSSVIMTLIIFLIGTLKGIYAPASLI